MQSYVQSKVRDIVDFPKKGIVFRDITTAVKDPKALKFMIDFLTEQFEDKKIDYVKFYKGRITRVILPYLLWVFIFYIFFVNHHYFEFSWDGLFHAWWRGDLVGHFYFVIIM